MPYTVHFRKGLIVLILASAVFIAVGAVLVFQSIHHSQVFSSRISVSIRQKALVHELTQLLLTTKEKTSKGEQVASETEAISRILVKWENTQRGLVSGGELYGIAGSNSAEIQNLLLSVSSSFVGISDQIHGCLTDGSMFSAIDVNELNRIVTEYSEGMDQVTGQFVNESSASLSYIRYAVIGIILLALVFYIYMYKRVLLPGAERLRFAAEEVRVMKSDLDKANQVKTEFMANMSHEIRTPLNGVIGMAEILSATTLSPDQRDYARSIHSSAINLMDIVNDILDYSQIESGKLEIHKERFVLAECFEQISDLLKPLARQKKLELISDIDPAIPKEIVHDERRIRQVLLNLLNNAVKFTDYGEIVLRAELVTRESDFVQIKFSVRDTGIGIDSTKLPHLFKSFFQADSSTSKKYGGSGLGLAICKSLASAMGGKIWAESTQGKGSTFYFTIVAETFGESKSSRVRGLSGLKAVVVDDNKTNLKILVKQLSSWGIQATPFNSPDIVTEIIPTLHKFDFCIIDMQMPEMNGRDLIEKIREVHPKSSLPIIVLSSIGQHLVDQKGDLYNVYLTKPVKQSKLLDAIVEVLKLNKTGLPEDVSATGTFEGDFGMPRLNVLIAHDNELTQAVTERTLEMMGCSIKVAHSGQEVLDESRISEYDLIIMDVDLPELNGVETVRRLKKFSGSNELPVIFGITKDPDIDKKMCLQAGMDDLVARPMNPEELQRKIHYWFEETEES